MLVLEDICRLLLKKDAATGKHPYLDQLFSYLMRKELSTTTSGYFERVMVRLLNLSPELVEYIKLHEYLPGQICAGIRDPCISGFLAAIFMKDSCGVYVTWSIRQLYFKKELVRKLATQALQDSTAQYFEGIVSVIEGLVGSKDC